LILGLTIKADGVRTEEEGGREERSGKKFTFDLARHAAGLV
jgi:hypothetical protein